ncbi:MAG: T9SS type A sorting domain-containing protein [Flavobacteriales bacterium]
MNKRNRNNKEVSNESTLDYFDIFPNPTSDHIFLTSEIPSDVVQARVIIYDSKGSEVKNEVITKLTRFDVTRFPSGFYTVKFILDDLFVGSKSFIVTR